MKTQELKVPTMLTLQEAVKRTGLSYNYIRQGCMNGTIVHIKCGRKYLVNLDKLILMLNGEEK